MALRIVNHNGIADVYADIAAAVDSGLYTPATGDFIYVIDIVTTYIYTIGGTWDVYTGGGGITDGDKGDITVSGAGTSWTLDVSAASLVGVADNSIAYSIALGGI